MWVASRHVPETSKGGEPSLDLARGGLEPEALLLLGETYLKMHKWPDARAQFNRRGRFIQNHLSQRKRKFAYAQIVV